MNQSEGPTELPAAFILWLKLPPPGTAGQAELSLPVPARVGLSGWTGSLFSSFHESPSARGTGSPPCASSSNAELGRWGRGLRRERPPDEALAPSPW